MSTVLAGPLIAAMSLVAIAVGGPDRARTAARRMLAGILVFAVTFVVALWAAYTTGNPLAVGLVRMGQEASGLGLRAPPLAEVSAIDGLPSIDPAMTTALAGALAGLPPPASPALDALPPSDQQALAGAWQQVSAEGRPGFDALASALEAAEAASPGFQARLAAQVEALPEGVDIVPGPDGARWGRDTLARALAGEAASDAFAAIGSADDLLSDVEAAMPPPVEPAMPPPVEAAMPPPVEAVSMPPAALEAPSEALPGRFVAPPRRGLLTPIPFANPARSQVGDGG